MVFYSAGRSTRFAGKSMELIKEGDNDTGKHQAFIMLSETPVFIK